MFFGLFPQIKLPKGTIHHVKPNKKKRKLGLVIVQRPPCKRTILITPVKGFEIPVHCVRLQFPYTLYRLHYQTYGSFWKPEYEEQGLNMAFSKTEVKVEGESELFSVPLPNFVSCFECVCLGDYEFPKTKTIVEQFDMVTNRFWNTNFLVDPEDWENLQLWQVTGSFNEDGPLNKERVFTPVCD